MMVRQVKVLLLALVLAQLLWVSSSVEDEEEEEDEGMMMQFYKQMLKLIEDAKSSCQAQCGGKGGGGGRKVAFTAVLHPPRTNGVGVIGPFLNTTTLVYSDVITNIGKAYSANTGEFRAPVKGVYFFTFTSYALGTRVNIGTALFRNDAEVVRVWEIQDTGDDEDYATNSATLVLEPGDVVRVRLPRSLRVAASVETNRNTFSGFLLYEL